MKTVIGLEIHVQLKTKSKMFCGCDNNAYKADEAQPNILVCPICLGMPGILPVANKQAIEWTIKTGLALNCQIADFSRFDRKHYFYPDLPKNYQISQYDKPFCLEGIIEIETADGLKEIRIKRVHLEEDAGKLVHPQGADHSLVDLNRAGTPLMEIVTEPDISTPADAKIFIQELRAVMRYLDVSDADMEKGHLRCDANISLQLTADGKQQEGTPVEIKNLNSFRMVERALSFEEKRQKEALEKGEKIVKETRGWDDNKGISISQRSKEQAQDYRYFPEPDLPPFDLQKLFDIDELARSLPELPAKKRERYIHTLYIPENDAAILSLDKEMAAYFERVAEVVSTKTAANWVINELKSDGLLLIKPEDLADLLVRLESGEISGKIAKEIFSEMKSSGKKPGEIIDEKGIKQIGSENELSKIIEEVISEQEKSVADYREGKKEALGYLIGQVMAKTHGQANPQIVNRLLQEKLN